MSVLVIYKTKGREMPYTRKKRETFTGIQHWYLGSCSLLLWEQGEKVDLSCGCSKASVPRDVVWHQRGWLLPRCLSPPFMMGSILASFLPLVVVFSLKRGQDFSETCSTQHKGNLALVLTNSWEEIYSFRAGSPSLWQAESSLGTAQLRASLPAKQRAEENPLKNTGILTGCESLFHHLPCFPSLYIK